MVDPVAAAPLSRLARPAALGAATALATLLIAAALYFLGGWIGSSVPRNAGWQEPDSGVTIMVETNGVHTGLVMPVVSEVKDWRETFPELAGAYAGGVTHIAVGWGEREVFLDVPTWAELKPLTAARIALLGGDTLLRVAEYVRPSPGPNHRPLRLTHEQYRRLVQGVEATLAPVPTGAKRERIYGSYATDAYYEARGRYGLFNTCNSWTGDLLARAGVRMGWWTPFAGGVMKWIEPPRETVVTVAG